MPVDRNRMQRGNSNGKAGAVRLHVHVWLFYINTDPVAQRAGAGGCVYIGVWRGKDVAWRGSFKLG